MAEVESYSLLFYGGPQGYQTNRTQIQLSDADGQTLAWLRFNDAGMLFEADYESDGIIRMQLPSGMSTTSWTSCATRAPSTSISPRAGASSARLPSRSARKNDRPERDA